MEQQRPFQPSGIFLFDSKNPSRDGNSTGLWIVASNDIISKSRVYCAERRATYTYVPAWSGVFLLPLGYTLSFTCWSERETEVPAAGEDRVNGLPFCGLRPRCFSLRRSECKPWRAREYRAEEKRKSNNRREKWARFESGYETEHRRITVGEILSAVPLTRSAEKCARQRQIQFWITLPMGNSWPRTLWRTESYGFGGEWKNSVWITIILKTSLILRENLKLGEITLSDILDHCLITKYRASIFIYIYSQEH